MTTPPEPTTPGELIEALRSRVELLEGEIVRYADALQKCREISDQRMAALKRWGTHAYTCQSEHGRYPRRCSCGLHEVLHP